jgi:hypothetical protein
MDVGGDVWQLRHGGAGEFSVAFVSEVHGSLILALPRQRRVCSLEALSLVPLRSLRLGVLSAYRSRV